MDGTTAIDTNKKIAKLLGWTGIYEWSIGKVTGHKPGSNKTNFLDNYAESHEDAFKLIEFVGKSGFSNRKRFTEILKKTLEDKFIYSVEAEYWVFLLDPDVICDAFILWAEKTEKTEGGAICVPVKMSE